MSVELVYLHAFYYSFSLQKAGAISKSKLPREEKAEPNDDQSRFDFDKFCIEMDSGALRDLGLDVRSNLACFFHLTWL